MFRWLFTTAVLSFALSHSTCGAQSPSSPNPDPNAAAPAVSPETQTKATAPKKVWTNENLAGANGKVSVVGDKRNQKYTSAPDKLADPATVTRIHDSLKKLQTQLDGVNQQLISFKEFQEGGTVAKADNEIPQGYTRVPVNQQIPVLEEKKKKLQAQIDDLLDEARKKGIEPGQLR